MPWSNQGSVRGAAGANATTTANASAGTAGLLSALPAAPALTYLRDTNVFDDPVFANRNAVVFDDCETLTYWVGAVSGTGVGTNVGGSIAGCTFNGYAFIHGLTGSTAAGAFSFFRPGVGLVVGANAPGLDVAFLTGLQALSNATDTYRARYGWCNASGAATGGNLIGLEHGGTASPNWRFAYGLDSAPTYVDTGVSAVAATAQNLIRFQIAPGWAQVKVWINGTLTNTLTGLSLPVSSYNAFWRVTKSAGTASLDLGVDCFWLRPLSR